MRSVSLTISGSVGRRDGCLGSAGCSRGKQCVCSVVSVLQTTSLERRGTRGDEARQGSRAGEKTWSRRG